MMPDFDRKRMHLRLENGRPVALVERMDDGGPPREYPVNRSDPQAAIAEGLARRELENMLERLEPKGAPAPVPHLDPGKPLPRMHERPVDEHGLPIGSSWVDVHRNQRQPLGAAGHPELNE